MTKLWAGRAASNGRVLRDEEVAAALTAAGHPMSAHRLARLRHGDDEASEDLVEALAKFFGVTPPYFDNPTAMAGQGRIVSGFSDPRFRRLLRLADGLSPESQHLLYSTALHLRRAEELGSTGW
ncbi:transcriptional regulator [Nocardia thraciensis]